MLKPRAPGYVTDSFSLMTGEAGALDPVYTESRVGCRCGGLTLKQSCLDSICLQNATSRLVVQRGVLIRVSTAWTTATLHAGMPPRLSFVGPSKRGPA